MKTVAFKIWQPSKGLLSDGSTVVAAKAREAAISFLGTKAVRQLHDNEMGDYISVQKVLIREDGILQYPARKQTTFWVAA